MRIDAARVSRRLVPEVAGQPEYGSKLVTGLWIEIGVAQPAVERAMTEADVGQIAGAVLADRNVAGQIGHVIDRRRSGDRKSTRLNSSHTVNSYAVFCLKKKKKKYRDGK